MNRVIIDLIESKNGIVHVRMKKQSVEGDVITELGYHRTCFKQGDDIEATFAVIAEDFGAISQEDIAETQATATAAWEE